MNNLARALLLVGALVLALLVGVLIGRGQHATLAEGNAQSVQITTAPTPMAAAPLPAPVETPKPPPAIPKIAPDQQVQEDAAAVGMTTKPEAAPATASDAGNSQPPG